MFELNATNSLLTCTAVWMQRETAFSFSLMDWNWHKRSTAIREKTLNSFYRGKIFCASHRPTIRRPRSLSSVLNAGALCHINSHRVVATFWIVSRRFLFQPLRKFIRPRSMVLLVVSWDFTSVDSLSEPHAIGHWQIQTLVDRASAAGVPLQTPRGSLRCSPDS